MTYTILLKDGQEIEANAVYASRSECLYFDKQGEMLHLQPKDVERIEVKE